MTRQTTQQRRRGVRSRWRIVLPLLLVVLPLPAVLLGAIPGALAGGLAVIVAHLAWGPRPSARRLLFYVLCLLPSPWLFGFSEPQARGTATRLLVVVAATAVLSGVVERLLARRSRPPHRAWLVGLRLLRGAVAAVCVAVALVSGSTWGAVVVGIFPVVALAGGLLAFAWLLATVLRGRRRPRTWRFDIVVVALSFGTTGFFSAMATYEGAAPETCARLGERPGVEMRLPSVAIADYGPVSDCFPYDIAVDPERALLFFSCKQRRAGIYGGAAKEASRSEDGMIMVSLADGDFRVLDVVPVEALSWATYPTRIEVNPARREIYAVIIDGDAHHHVGVWRYGDKLVPIRSLPLRFEPIRVRVRPDDPDRLFVLGLNRGWAEFDLALGEPVRSGVLQGAPGFPMFMDDVTFTPDGRTLYLSTYAGYLLRVDSATMSLLDTSYCWSPLNGLEADWEGRRLFGAGTLLRQLVRFDSADGTWADSAYLGVMFRELVFDRARNLIYVLGYPEGRLLLVDADDSSVQREVRLGRLGRDVALDPSTGRLFAATSCGLAEVEPTLVLPSTP